MSSQSTFRSFNFKLYPNKAQTKTLESWLDICRKLYNDSLEQRQRAYRVEGRSVQYRHQQAQLTVDRAKDDELRAVPVEFLRSSLRRLDHAFQNFFRRIKEGNQRPGYPRFKNADRYRSMVCTEPANYVGKNCVRIPKLGKIRARGQFQPLPIQKLLRVIRKPSGWYVQVLVEVQAVNALPGNDQEVGIDLGLEQFLTMDTGEAIGNPRHLKKSAKKLKRAQQKLAKCKKGSGRRKKAKQRVARIYERITNQRKGFCHRTSRELVNRFQRIAVENLNILGLSRGFLAKHVLDACWGTFLFQLTYKAENAGRTLVKVDPAGTSQTCPSCGRIRKKELSERIHDCPCGLVLNRDHASAIVIRERAFRSSRGEELDQFREEPASSVKRKGPIYGVSTS